MVDITPFAPVIFAVGLFGILASGVAYTAADTTKRKRQLIGILIFSLILFLISVNL